MILPKITWTYARRRARCRWCGGDVTVGSPMIRITWWDAKRGWSRRKIYHKECYITSICDYFDNHPYVAVVPSNAGRGRPKLDITDEQRSRRGRLLKLYHYHRERKKRLAWDDPQLEGIHTRMRAIAIEMMKLGGIPRRWGRDMDIKAIERR